VDGQGARDGLGATHRLGGWVGADDEAALKGKSALQVLLCIDLEPDQLYPVPGQEETWEGSRAAFAWAKRWRAAGPRPSGSLGRGIAGRWALTFSSDTAESERVLASWLDEVGGMLVARTRSDHFLDRLQAIDARLDFLARRSQGACFTTADRVPGLAPPA
jgi:hypothetical protein